jgi:hypothetical protein
VGEHPEPDAVQTCMRRPLRGDIFRLRTIVRTVPGAAALLDAWARGHCRHRFARAIISQTVWSYQVVGAILTDVELLFGDDDVVACREAVRQVCGKVAASSGDRLYRLRRSRKASGTWTKSSPLPRTRGTIPNACCFRMPMYWTSSFRLDVIIGQRCASCGGFCAICKMISKYRRPPRGIAV